MPKEIASGIAITCLIFTVSVYMPIIGFFCAIFIPLPILFYRAKLGRKTGAMVPIATVIIMATVIGRLSVDILVFSELMLLGFLLEELFEYNLSVEKTVLIACSTILLTGIGCLVFYSNISNTGITALVTLYVAKNLELTLTLYQSMGVPEENIRMISESMEQIRYVLVRVIPAFAIVSILFICWTNILMARSLLTFQNLHYPSFGRLNLWKAPDQLVWGVIGCGLLLLLAGKGLKMMGLNVILVLMAIYFFQGIAVISFFFQKKNFPRLLRIFFYSLIALQQMFLLIVIGCGFFDMWMNFRKLDTSKEQ